MDGAVLNLETTDLGVVGPYDVLEIIAEKKQAANAAWRDSC